MHHFALTLYCDVSNRVRIWCETAECYREAVVEACHSSINSTANSTDNSTATTARAADGNTPATTAGAAADTTAANTLSSLYTGKSSQFHTFNKCTVWYEDVCCFANHCLHTHVQTAI
jgi:hypothetical protein